MKCWTVRSDMPNDYYMCWTGIIKLKIKINNNSLGAKNKNKNSRKKLRINWKKKKFLFGAKWKQC